MNRLAFLSLLLVGCAVEDADLGPQLLVPDEVPVDWDASLDGVDDGLVALVPVDVMVYDSQSGDPMQGMDIELMGVAPDTLLAHVDDVYATAAPDESSEDDGEPTLWDAWRDRYVTVAMDAPSERLTVTTDETGLARVYVVVDRLADGAGATVVVRSEDLEHTILLRPL